MLEGPAGPVSHLVCGGVYDWSTGLIYKDGRYFDPALGIWLALLPLVILALSKKQSKYKVPHVFFLLLSFAVTNITACKNEEQFREKLAQHCIDTYPTPGPVNPNTCTALPTSDAEPVYNPSEWGDCWTSQYCNNCYSYALDRKSSCDWQEIEADRQDHLHPGEITGHPYFSGVTSREELFKATTCENIVSAIVKHDGYFVADCEGKCRPGHYKVALFIDPYEENIPGDTADYHFYRQDAGGCWSHKPGKFFATNLDASGNIIADPRLSNADYSPDGPNYKEFCDCFCIPREG